MNLKAVLTCAVCSAAVLQSTNSFAALTDSEKGQLQSFFAAADLSTVARFRSLSARPDLSEAEVAEALSSALREQPFTDVRQRYAHEVLFGPASQSSRTTLIAPVSRALLARADQVLRDRPGTHSNFLETEPTAFEELMRIHQFVGKSLSPTGGLGSTLRNDSLRSVAQAYGAHVSAQATLLSHRNRAEGRGLLLRAQVSMNLSQLGSTLSNRDEVASWLGLEAVAKGFFLRTGVVLETVGEGPAVRVAEVTRLLESAPGALQGVTLVLVDKVNPTTLQPSTALLPVRTALGSLAPAREGWWPAGQGEAPEQALCEVAWAAGSRLTREAFKSKPKLAELASGALQRAAGKGDATFLAPWLLSQSLDRDAATSTHPVTPQALSAASAAMLLVDARRTLDLALSRWVAGQAQAFEQALLGLNVLSANAGDSLLLGQRGGKSSVRVSVTKQQDSVIGFQIDNHTWSIERSDKGVISRLRIDNKEPGSWAVSSASVPLTGGDKWSAGSREFVRLAGTPRAALLEDGRLILAASSAGALEAIQTRAPAGDQELQASLRLESGQGGLVLLAAPGSSGFQGLALILSCEATATVSDTGAVREECKARLGQFDGAGQEQKLSELVAVGPPSATGFQVSLGIRGKQVQATVGGVELKGELTQAPKAGSAGVVIGAGGRLELRDWRLQAGGPRVPAGKRK